MPSESFYWFDYETFGTNPAFDRPCQFAGLRTNAELDIIDEPLLIYCKQAMDYLPHPAACRVTGISPQAANSEGVVESLFIDRIVGQLGKPGTCSVGYNNLKFDDEFTRHTLFRNFHDPYEYEWKDGNSRWDLLDLVRLTRALRPEGLNWPVKDDGAVSNRLEDLTRVNSIEHSSAHDALSDVHATIGMARLIKQAQPRLFKYAFQNRGKQAVASMLNMSKQNKEPCIQISGMIPAKRHHLGIIMPISQHPDRPNSMIVLDLHQDPTDLLTMSADEIERLLYQKNELSDSQKPGLRPGLRTVQINKCPVLVPLKTLRAQDALRLGVDLDSIERHRASALGLYEPDITQKIVKAMSAANLPRNPDVDASLYSGSFASKTDRQRQVALRSAPPSQILEIAAHFEDRRYRELAWRYLARNYPDSLDNEQLIEWQEHCRERLETADSPWLSFEAFNQEIEDMDWRDSQLALRDALRAYGLQIREYASANTEAKAH